MEIEIYDLFGEEIYCSVCLEHVKEGERTLMIQKCHHGFHQKCLDPWLSTNDSCPNCRSIVRLEERISETDRILVSWMLCDWILRIYPTKERLYTKRNALRTFIQNFNWNGIRPYPIDISSLSSLKRMKAQLKEKQQDLQEPIPRFQAIRRNARLREISEQVALRLQQFSSATVQVVRR